MKPVLGIIGGSGFYDWDLFAEEITEDQKELIPLTYGKKKILPSSPIRTCEIEGIRCFLISRHGLKHEYSPSEVPYNANIYALKALGATHVVSVCAVGSLSFSHPVGTPFIVDQVIDFTKKRDSTFFVKGAVAHVSMARPFCDDLRKRIFAAGVAANTHARNSACYVCIEGPQFSTEAESRFYQTIGGNLVGMSLMPEAKLAREANLHYAAIAIPSDYDCGLDQGCDPVTTEAIIAQMSLNTKKAKDLIYALCVNWRAVKILDCGCKEALSKGLVRDPSKIPTRNFNVKLLKVLSS